MIIALAHALVHALALALALALSLACAAALAAAHRHHPQLPATVSHRHPLRPLAAALALTDALAAAPDTTAVHAAAAAALVADGGSIYGGFVPHAAWVAVRASHGTPWEPAHPDGLRRAAEERPCALAGRARARVVHTPHPQR